MIKLQEVVNPAAVGWRWSNDEEDGLGTIEHEITWTRGTVSLMFGTKTKNGTWTTTTIDNPERFGFDGTLASARRAANEFVNS